MSALINIKHIELYDQVSDLRRTLSEIMSDLESKYKELKSELKGFDSATNMELMEVIEQNQRKAAIEVETLDKLLLFIRNKAEEYETIDNTMVRAMSNISVAPLFK